MGRYTRSYGRFRRRRRIFRRRFQRRYGVSRRSTPRRYSGRGRQPLHNICRSFSPNPVDIYGGIGLAYSFQLQDLPSYTEFAPLFDYYRINAVKITFMPPFNVENLEDVSTYNSKIPIIHSAPIYDDTTAPSVATELMQRSGYRRQRLNRPVSFYVKPAMLLQGDDNSFDLTFWKRWIKTSNTNVNYYGYLFYIEGSQTANSINCQVFIKYYMQFKGIK